MIYIWDIDGTLSNSTHRRFLVEQEKKDWTRFYEEAANDDPIWDTVDLYNTLIETGAYSVLMTGRPDNFRSQTEEWLVKYLTRWDGLYMRKAGDHRDDFVVKAEMLDKFLAETKVRHIAGVFEDRKQCVDMYRARGLQVFQVAEGNF